MGLPAVDHSSAHKAPHGCDKPIDLVHLANQTMGDRELERELLSLFLSQSSEYLREFTQAESWEGKKNAAHKIKGAARGLGAWKLGDAAEATENKLENCDLALEAAINQVIAYIRQLQS